MIIEGIVLGHMVPCSGIEVEKENIYAIEKLPYQKDIRGI
jgi:hypothetical protein